MVLLCGIIQIALALLGKQKKVKACFEVRQVCMRSDQLVYKYYTLLI